MGEIDQHVSWFSLAALLLRIGRTLGDSLSRLEKLCYVFLVLHEYKLGTLKLWHL